jgi:hypothetical protein
MSLRRAAPLALGLWVLACQPSLNSPGGGQVATPPVNAAVFNTDPAAPPIPSPVPSPNDLAIQALGAPGTATAKQELANLLISTYGGVPPDQSGAQITFTTTTIDPATGTATVGPLSLTDPIDMTTVNSTTVAMVRTDTGEVLALDSAASSFDVDPATPTVGTLTLVPVKSGANDLVKNRRWPQGARIAVAVRGGPNGVKTKRGAQIQPSEAIQIITLPAVEAAPLGLVDPSLADSLLVATIVEQQGALGPAKLEALRQTYAKPKMWMPCPYPTGCPGVGVTYPQGTWIPADATSAHPTWLSAFAAVDKVFPHAEVASIQTFTVGSLLGTWVEIDPAAGHVPLPSSFIDLKALAHADGTPTATGKSFGALAAGLATLDGFSTSAMLLAPTSSPVSAATVTNATTFVFDLTNVFLPTPGSPVLLNDLAAAGPAGKYLTEPPPITVDTGTGLPCSGPPYGATCVSTVVGLQPAVTVPLGSAIYTLPPLKESTTYAVVITKSAQGSYPGMVRNTVGRVLFDFTNPLFDGTKPEGSRSLLPNLTDTQAAGFQQMRTLFQNAVFPTLQALKGVAASNVAMAYTFKTQSITGKGAVSPRTGPAGAIQFAALPYLLTSFPDAPTVTATLTPAQAEQKYGLPPQLGLAASNAVAAVIEANLVTWDLLDPASGAFHTSAASGTASSIPALVVVPASLPANAPLVVFRHGINQGRADVLLMAGALAQGGMVAVAIDAAKHGDRSWCRQSSECATGTCVTDPTLAHQGDAVLPPGACKLGDGNAGQLAYNPVSSSCTQALGCWNGTGGKAQASGNFFISANLFRTRDSFRQDIIDQSALVRAFTSANGQAALRAALTSPGSFSIDATKVYYVGQSLGAIQGTVDVAANPRISKAVLNVGGGTLPDIFDRSPAFSAQITQLLTGIGITKGTPEYLQFLQVAKWALDPADPINFAQSLIASPLPNLLADSTGATAQSAKTVLGQGARCDNVVPNSTNQLLYGLIGLEPLNPTGDPAGTGAGPLQWFMTDDVTACPTDGTTGRGATHGFLLDFINSTMTATAQGDAVSFLGGGPVHLTPVVTP